MPHWLFADDISLQRPNAEQSIMHTRTTDGSEPYNVGHHNMLLGGGAVWETEIGPVFGTLAVVGSLTDLMADVQKLDK